METKEVKEVKEDNKNTLLISCGEDEDKLPFEDIFPNAQYYPVVAVEEKNVNKILDDIANNRLDPLLATYPYILVYDETRGTNLGVIDSIPLTPNFPNFSEKDSGKPTAVERSSGSFWLIDTTPDEKKRERKERVCRVNNLPDEVCQLIGSDGMIRPLQNNLRHKYKPFYCGGRQYSIDYQRAEGYNYLPRRPLRIKRKRAPYLGAVEPLMKLEVLPRDIAKLVSEHIDECDELTQEGRLCGLGLGHKLGTAEWEEYKKAHNIEFDWKINYAGTGNSKFLSNDGKIKDCAEECVDSLCTNWIAYTLTNLPKYVLVTLYGEEGRTETSYKAEYDIEQKVIGYYIGISKLSTNPEESSLGPEFYSVDGKNWYGELFGKYTPLPFPSSEVVKILCQYFKAKTTAKGYTINFKLITEDLNSVSHLIFHPHTTNARFMKEEKKEYDFWAKPIVWFGSLIKKHELQDFINKATGGKYKPIYEYALGNIWELSGLHFHYVEPYR